MKPLYSLILFGFFLSVHAQTNPAITHFLKNTTQTGSYYMQGNSTAIGNGLLVNCQQVAYTNDYSYITCTGIPSYPTGPFLDGNPSQAQDQSAIYEIPLNPVPETGTPSSTTGGNIGVFINGVSLFDYRDGVAWNPSTNALCGGAGNPPCPGGPGASMDWNRDAIPAEMAGFDCSKGHPAMGNYHHHQNPSAFKLDLNVVSTICNLYDADGLYAIDSTQHSPLIGFAYDGYPIYGAYGFANTDGTGGIARMQSSYQLRNMTQRSNGPAVDATYFLGYFREDYEYIAQTAEDRLDEHNGRFCITPEYPNGTYAYFCYGRCQLEFGLPLCRWTHFLWSVCQQKGELGACCGHCLHILVEHRCGSGTHEIQRIPKSGCRSDRYPSERTQSIGSSGGPYRYGWKKDQKNSDPRGSDHRLLRCASTLCRHLFGDCLIGKRAQNIPHSDR